MIASASTLQSVLDFHKLCNPGIKEATVAEYAGAVRMLDRYNGAPTLVSDLSETFVLGFMHWLLEVRKSSPVTVNGKRKVILLLWRLASERGLIGAAPRIRRVKAPKRLATAWSPTEVARILKNVSAGQPKRFCESRRLWTCDHWCGLILTIYDTSHRLRCLLDVPRSCYDPVRQELRMPAEIIKQNADMVHRLHPQTCAFLDKLPPSKLLFQWPRHRREIWRCFRRIIHAAGLPSTRRDLFHRLRRTSYTLVAVSHGIHAATRHAGHGSDLSAAYLDRRFLPEPDALDALPRP